MEKTKQADEIEHKEEPQEFINLIQGCSNIITNNTDISEGLKIIKEKINEFLNLKNVFFLLGSGTSSGAISTMSSLYDNLDFQGDEELRMEFESISKNAENDLEACLSVMYAARAYYEGIKTKLPNESNNKDSSKINNEQGSHIDTQTPDCNKKLELYKKLINRVEQHIFDSINIDFDNPKAKEVLELYKLFYQKLALRNKDLSRLRIFTTNNDLFNEKALDHLNIHYINGFGGGINRYFNPALFNYTWSKRMDTSIDKYEPIENMVYLYKIHGSINWREAKEQNNNYFEVKEVSPSETEYKDTVLIYPTPTKQDKSLGCPYVDLFREFQHQLLLPHSVLFIIGYSFSDRHVNEIIYRALATNSTINIVIFGSVPKGDKLKSRAIFSIKDSRIFVINGSIRKYNTEDETEKEKLCTINHFDFIVNELLPNLDASRSEDKILNDFVKKLKDIKHEDR